LLIAWVATADPSVLSVEQAVAMAVRSDPSVAAARKEWDAARWERRGARSLENPSILASPAIGSINGTTEELLVTQPLGVNGTRVARARSADAHVSQARWRWETAVRALAVSVRVAMVDVWRERSLRAWAREDLDGAESMERLVRTQVELGSRPGVETARAALERVRAAQRLASSEGRMRAAEARLSSLLGLPMGAPVPVVDAPPFPTVLPELARGIGDADRRAELGFARSQRDGVRFDLDGVRAEGRPDVAPQFRAQQIFTRAPRSNDYGFSVAIRLPLLDWGGQRARVAQGRASVGAADHRVDAVRREIAAEVTASHARLEAASRVWADVETALAESERLMVSVTKGFEEGAVALPAVIDARRARRETRIEAVEARAEIALASIAWDRATASGELPAEVLR